MIVNQNLAKKERLNSKKDIESVFTNGDVIKAYPILFSYEVIPSDKPQISVLFTVSKKKQKLAVNRNKIKRRLKEAYRLNKLSLCEFSLESKTSINLMIIQVTGDDVSFSTIEKKMIKGLSKLVDSLSNVN